MASNIIDLRDTTFLIPIRFDSPERKANLQALLNVLARDYSTNIIVLEGDKNRQFYPENRNRDIDYRFTKDNDRVFYRTKYINQMLREAQTPFAAIWDTDAIGLPWCVLETVKALRNGEVVMAFPYDGRFHTADRVISGLFRQTLDYRALTEYAHIMSLMHGYHSVGGAFMVNRLKYLEAGGENENFYGWGPEDAERVKRMEILGLPVHYTQGVLFHLWHPRKQNSWYANKNIEIRNRNEYIRICRSTKDDLLKQQA